jgi:hypothetical protein
MARMSRPEKNKVRTARTFFRKGREAREERQKDCFAFPAFFADRKLLQFEITRFVENRQ